MARGDYLVDVFVIIDNPSEMAVMVTNGRERVPPVEFRDPVTKAVRPTRHFRYEVQPEAGEVDPDDPDKPRPLSARTVREALRVDDNVTGAVSWRGASGRVGRIRKV